MSERMMNETSTNSVTATDFPQPTSRLQALMSKFRGNTPVNVQTSPNPLADVQIVSEIANQSFEELSPEHQNKVLAKIQGIDYTSAVDIHNFGGATGSPLTKLANTILKKYASHEFGDLADPVTDLVATLKTNNPKNVVSKVKIDSEENHGIFSILQEISTLKNARKKMIKLMAQFANIEQNLQAINDELKKQQVDLYKDISVYEQMTEATFDQIYDFELDCIALDLMIEDAQLKLNQIISKGKINQLEAAQAQKLQLAINRMIDRKNTIMSVKVSALQGVPTISGIVLGNEVICGKITEVELLVIPVWTWQYAIAAGHLRQQEALSVQKTIRGITSKLLTGNAKMLHDNVIAAQEELYAASIAIEDLQTVQNYIDDMVTTIQQKRKEAVQNCLQGMETMKEIEQKNYNLLSQQLTETVPAV